MTVPLIADGLTVRLGGQTVLDRLSARFEPGRVTCIIGPNGAGKSTLMACLAGLRKPDAGRASLGEAPLLAMGARPRARRIGFLPQTPQVAWAVEARTLIGLGRTPFIGASGLGTEDDAAVDRAMAAAQVEPFARRVVNTLSGGERARVLIARALAGEPEWLLADEPLTGLDPGHQIDACDLLRRLAHDQGCGVLMTLHDLPMALRVADHVLVMAEGRSLAQGAPVEVLTPAILDQAYGVRTRLTQGEGGPLLELLGRSGD
jgi:iron complex transport system ATP-binding protein